MKLKAALTLLALLAASILPLHQGFSHPVTYKGGFAVMTWNQPFLNDVWGLYSFRRDMAIVARGMRMEMPGGDAWAYFPQFDYLLKRWNDEDFQANIYLYGGAGGANGEKGHGVMGLTGAEADLESRRLFFLAKWESLFTPIDSDVHTVLGRVGVAPYTAEFNQLATWIMVQVQYHPALRREFAVSPMLRLFYRNFLIEGGSSIKGEWMVNGMIHF